MNKGGYHAYFNTDYYVLSWSTVVAVYHLVLWRRGLLDKMMLINQYMAVIHTNETGSYDEKLYRQIPPIELFHKASSMLEAVKYFQTRAENIGGDIICIERIDVN